MSVDIKKLNTTGFAGISISCLTYLVSPGCVHPKLNVALMILPWSSVMRQSCPCVAYVRCCVNTPLMFLSTSASSSIPRFYELLCPFVVFPPYHVTCPSSCRFFDFQFDIFHLDLQYYK